MPEKEGYIPKFNTAQFQAVLLLLATLVGAGIGTAEAQDDPDLFDSHLQYGLPDYVWSNVACGPFDTYPHYSILPNALAFQDSFRVQDRSNYWTANTWAIEQAFAYNEQANTITNERRVIERGIGLADRYGMIHQAMGFNSIRDYVDNIIVIPGSALTDTILEERKSWATTLTEIQCVYENGAYLPRTNIIAFSTDSIQNYGSEDRVNLYPGLVVEEAIQTVTFFSEVMRAQIEGLTPNEFYFEWTHGGRRLLHELQDAIIIQEAYRAENLGSNYNALALSGYQVAVGSVITGRDVENPASIDTLAIELIRVANLSEQFGISTPLDLAQALSDPVLSMHINAYTVQTYGVHLHGFLTGGRPNHRDTFWLDTPQASTVGPVLRQMIDNTYNLQPTDEPVVVVPSATHTATEQTPSQTPTDLPTVHFVVPAQEDSTATPVPVVTEAQPTVTPTPTNTIEPVITAIVDASAEPTSTPIRIVIDADGQTEFEGGNEQSRAMLELLKIIIPSAVLITALGAAGVGVVYLRSKNRSSRSERSRTRRRRQSTERERTRTERRRARRSKTEISDKVRRINDRLK